MKIAFFLLSLFPSLALAQPVFDDPLGGQTLEELISAITRWLTSIGSIVVTIMILIGAFQMIFAGGKPEEFKKGQKTILYAVIGLVIILIANGITAIVKSVLVTS
ncbi:MAG: pilin [Candidatus Harrisonbacteria bacterium]|nr:pilin [Candidatus Harrisonbacteria bacterium]